eukprot:TRINITY_DN47491_c0_g1_i1.p1 TRINITY_DN47491_c0_g1~~TRINITY_DN47491_c0_g1_i1.p1  ORF type:complete len:506 (+),score=128.76 TRINITY_DN47491_c0_g1_i1:95-1612(+)
MLSTEPNAQFTSPRALPASPTWAGEANERRLRTKDSRVRRQLRDDAQFQGTNIEAVWCMIKEHAPARADWEMNHEGFINFCRQGFVTSDYITGKLLKIFDKDDKGVINGVWLAKMLHTMVNDRSNELYYLESFEQYRRPLDEDGIGVDYLQALKLPDPNQVVSKKGKKKKGPEEVERDGNVTYQMQEAMKSCIDRLAAGGKALVARQVMLADFKRWWYADSALVAAHIQQVLEVTASVYYKKDLPKLSKEFLASLEPPSEDFKDHIPFANTRVGMLICMTPFGFAPGKDRYVGTVLSKTRDFVTMYWRPPDDGGPPLVADTPGAKQYSKYDTIMSNLEDMMRSQYRSLHDIAPAVPLLQPGTMNVERERIEPKEWWDGDGRPVRMIPFCDITVHVPDDPLHMPDGRLVRMTPFGMDPAEDRYMGTIVGRTEDAVVMYWHPPEEGGPPAPMRDRPEPRDWWEGAGRPVRMTGAFSDHDSWLLRELERRDGVMPLDPKPKKGGKKRK